MIIVLTENAKRQIEKFPETLKKKLRKQFILLQQDFRHHSLRTRKMMGEEKYEARIDYHYRFTYRVEEKKIVIFSVGPHDEGLGKK